MEQQTFYLLAYSVAGKLDHHVATREEDLPAPHPASIWSRYKLTVEDEILVEVEAHASRTEARLFTLDTHNGQQVKVHCLFMIIGAKWRPTRTSNPAVRDLLELMMNTIPAARSNA